MIKRVNNKQINKVIKLGLSAKDFDNYIEENCLTAINKRIDKSPIIKLLIEKANLYDTQSPTETMYRLYSLIKISSKDIQDCKNALSYVLDNLQKIEHSSAKDCHAIADFLVSLYSTEDNIFIDDLKNKIFIGSSETLKKLLIFTPHFPTIERRIFNTF